MGIMEDPQDADEFDVYIFPPDDSKQDFTINICAKVEDLIAAYVPEKKHIRSWVSDDDAHISVELVDRSERDREVPEIKEALRKYFEEVPEAEVTFERWHRRRVEDIPSPVLRSRGGMIEIQGPEQAQLERLIGEVIPIIEQIPGVRDVLSDLQRGRSEMHFKLDRDTAALLQVTPQSIAWHLSAAQRRGEFSTMRLKREDEEIEIVFQQVTEERASNEIDERGGGLTLREMQRLPVFAPTLMTTLPLEDLGVFERVRGAGRIQRQNQSRIIRLRYGLMPDTKHHEVEPMVRAVVDNYPLPAGFTMTLGGFSRHWHDMMSSVRMVIWVSILLVYMLLAAILESFAVPLVIMISLPFAFVGIVWSLLLTDTGFDELAGFGVIFLIGILPNSALLLLHFVQVMRRERFFPRERAMMIAGYTRLRPILMTVGTTVLALLPMAFETTDNPAWVPFARVAIGGLLTSTVLTLIIVPGVYFGVEDTVRLLKRICRWIASWRWVLVFWSKRKRVEVRERLTAYRRKPPREEPLIIYTKNLTRIYDDPILVRVQAFLRRLVWWGPAGSPVVGLLPYERSRLGFTPDSWASSPTKRRKALAGIELRIESGMFGLLGPNGAGKTTFLRLLAGVDRPTRGFISALGYDYARELKRVQKQIGYLPQTFGVYSSLPAEKYLDYLALLKGLKDKCARRAAIDRVLEMVNLSHVRDVPVGNFSGGMMRRIGLAQVFLNPPKILIVDEPTAGLDPLERVRFRNLLTGLATDRVVILSTHIVEDIAHTCPRLAVLQDGEVTFVGETRELIASAEGCVWELLSTDESVWRQIHAKFRVVSQLQTAQGIRMRIASETCPHEQARNIPPTMEDAYILHMASSGSLRSGKD